MKILKILIIFIFFFLIGFFLFRKGKVVPLNDYDIYIITQKPVNFNILKKISKKSSKRISANSQFSFSESSSLMEFYVDFRNMTFKELKKIEPLIKYFEIRESAKIIFGRNIKKDMPNSNKDNSNIDQKIIANTKEKTTENQNVCVIPLCFVGKNLRVR